MRALLLLAAPLLLANTEEQEIPPPVRTMLDAAMASGNEGEVATIVKYAQAADPANAQKIMQIAATWRNERSKASVRRLRDADFLTLVKGRAELGAYATTGNVRNIGLTGVLALQREGLEWRHKLRVQADYQESLGVVSQERYLAAYEPNWKLGERAYIYGAAQYEKDRFSGFYDRFSVSTGAGYSAIKSAGVRLDLEVGPAFRHTRFTDDTIESNVAGRGSVDLDWKINRAITFRQNASAYLQAANSTVSSKSAVLARLIGPLSAQLSYTLQYESRPPAGRQTTDTTSRAALVVDF